MKIFSAFFLATLLLPVPVQAQKMDIKKLVTKTLGVTMTIEKKLDQNSAVPPELKKMMKDQLSKARAELLAAQSASGGQNPTATLAHQRMVQELISSLELMQKDLESSFHQEE